MKYKAAHNGLVNADGSAVDLRQHKGDLAETPCGQRKFLSDSEVIFHVISVPSKYGGATNYMVEDCTLIMREGCKVYQCEICHDSGYVYNDQAMRERCACQQPRLTDGEIETFVTKIRDSWSMDEAVEIVREFIRDHYPPALPSDEAAFLAGWKACKERIRGGKQIEDAFLEFRNKGGEG